MPFVATLLRLAERDLYRALWSPDIVDELRRNLIEAGLRADSVDRLIGQMRQTFPDAEVSGYRSIIDGLTCDPRTVMSSPQPCGPMHRRS